MTSQTSTPVREHDLAAVRAVPQQITQAWAANDADAFAEVFTDDARLILPGGVFCAGRDAIRSFMAGAYAGPYRGTRVFGEPIDVRAVTADVVLLVTKGGVLAPGDTSVAEGRAVRATWVLLRDGDGWRISSYQNTPLRAA